MTITKFVSTLVTVSIAVRSISCLFTDEQFEDMMDADADDDSLSLP